MSHRDDERERVLRAIVATIDRKHPGIAMHCAHVGAWSAAVALRLGVSETHVETIGQAGALHDIGKIGISASIINKPGPLTDDEWVLVRCHAVLGAEVVGAFEDPTRLAEVIRHHHERCDGQGYPGGLTRRAIPFGSRVVSVADVFDALTSQRSYRPALPRAAAIAHLERASVDGVLDRDIVAVAIPFFQTLENLPENSN